MKKTGWKIQPVLNYREEKKFKDFYAGIRSGKHAKRGTCSPENKTKGFPLLAEIQRGKIMRSP